MAVSSGHILNGISKMEESHQFFPVGEPFLYTPLNDPSGAMIIQAAKVDPKVIEDSHAAICSDLCCLNCFCMKPNNYTESGSNWIPVCSGINRMDNTQVYFKEF